MELQSRHGILVLSADSDFADPTTISGRALTMVESLRSAEDGRIKARNVLRGKRDLAASGRWPGGPSPFGYRIERVIVERRGRQEFDGSILVPDPASSMVPPRIYSLALEEEWGTRRIARAINDDPTIPQALKPMSAERGRQFLSSDIYIGLLTYGRHCTGIIDDCPIRDPVDVAELLVVPDLCTPLVEKAVAYAPRLEEVARSLDRSLGAAGLAASGSSNLRSPR